MAKTKKGKPLRIGSSAQRRRRDAQAAQWSRRYGGVGCYTTQMPHVSEAPRGARVIDCIGHYAVALALGGFIGYYRR